MRIFTFVYLSLALFGVSFSVFASDMQLERDDPREAFTEYRSVENIDIITPTVIEVPFSDTTLDSKQFLVRERTSGAYQPWYFDETFVQKPTNVTATADQSGNTLALVDGRRQTFADYLLPEDRIGKLRIILSAADRLTSSQLYIDLANNVALPLSIEIRATNAVGEEQIIVSSKRMISKRVAFPETTSERWTIDLTYGQLLRINEISLVETGVERQVTRGLRFLAQPDSSYDIFFNPDRSMAVPTSERGDLISDEGVVVIEASVSGSNTMYIPADVDGDGIRDLLDNCVSVANPEQEDINENGRGDACDDFDKDGRINSVDNCVNLPNRNQRDEDGDGIGDACDEEESRFTEKHFWIPWVGMGSAALVILVLFGLVIKNTRNPKEHLVEGEHDENHQSPQESPEANREGQ